MLSNKSFLGGVVLILGLLAGAGYLYHRDIEYRRIYGRVTEVSLFNWVEEVDQIKDQKPVLIYFEQPNSSPPGQRQEEGCRAYVAPGPPGHGGSAATVPGPLPGPQPLRAAAALAVLDAFEQEALLQRAVAIGKLARARLDAMQARIDAIGEVRGLGPMLALELVRDRNSKEPAPALTDAVIRACHEGGLIILKCGLYENVIRLHIPFVATDEEVLEGLSILEAALETQR